MSKREVKSGREESSSNVHLITRQQSNYLRGPAGAWDVKESIIGVEDKSG